MSFVIDLGHYYTKESLEKESRELVRLVDYDNDLDVWVDSQGKTYTDAEVYKKLVRVYVAPDRKSAGNGIVKPRVKMGDLESVKVNNRVQEQEQVKEFEREPEREPEPIKTQPQSQSQTPTIQKQSITQTITPAPTPEATKSINDMLLERVLMDTRLKNKLYIPIDLGVGYDIVKIGSYLGILQMDKNSLAEHLTKLFLSDSVVYQQIKGVILDILNGNQLPDRKDKKGVENGAILPECPQEEIITPNIIIDNQEIINGVVGGVEVLLEELFKKHLTQNKEMEADMLFSKAKSVLEHQQVDSPLQEVETTLNEILKKYNENE